MCISDPARMPRVLFVDDEQAVLDGLRRALHKHTKSWSLAFARSGAEALDLISKGGVDSVVTDVDMPEMDGFTLLRKIRDRKETRDLPVVILTGRHEDGIKRQALEEGATDLLSKPVDMMDLVARLGSMLRLKRYQDELRAHNDRLEVMVRQRTKELYESRLSVLWRLAKAGELRDEETGQHVIRVACCSLILANAIGLDVRGAELIFLASPLHDIGKIGIPDAILRKPGRLSADERRLVERHCELGAQILLGDTELAGRFAQWRGTEVMNAAATANPLLETAAEIALSHHERWDGSGYPRGLAGEKIPLSGRIVGLVDVYDALRSSRPYKVAMSEQAALSIITRNSAGQFQPLLMRAFLEHQNDIRDVYAQFLDPAETVESEAAHAPNNLC